jgi:hypothetical protein
MPGADLYALQKPCQAEVDNPQAKSQLRSQLLALSKTCFLHTYTCRTYAVKAIAQVPHSRRLFPCIAAVGHITTTPAGKGVQVVYMVFVTTNMNPQRDSPSRLPDQLQLLPLLL